MTWWQLTIAIVGGVLALWLVLLVLLTVAARASGDTTSMREALRLVPDVVRLVRRLAADRTVPRGVRIWLLVLLAYLLSPIDLVPDFIPVIGYADDAIIVAVVLRFVVRHAGIDALDRHWPGSASGLAAVKRLAGLKG
ncbi:MAG: DUF1232 domain-containing protein [Rhodoglobus sp.]